MSALCAILNLLLTIQSRQDLDAYAMDEVLLKPSHPRYKYVLFLCPPVYSSITTLFFSLQVEGLAEGRPSVLVGDFILVRQTQATDKTWFQGRVHQVFENYVSLRFDDTFSTYRGNSFDIRFVLNRLSFRRMHAAITNTNNPTRLLFPGLEHVRNMQRVTHALMNDIVPINRQIGEDPEQLECVAAIVNLPPGSPPFVVFGPCVEASLSSLKANYMLVDLEQARPLPLSKPCDNFLHIARQHVFLSAHQATLLPTSLLRGFRFSEPLSFFGSIQLLANSLIYQSLCAPSRSSMAMKYSQCRLYKTFANTV